MSAKGIVGTMLGVAGVGMLALGYVIDSILLAAVASPFLYFSGLLLGAGLHDGCPADRGPIDFDDVNEKVRTRAAVAEMIEPVPSEPVKRGRCGRPYSQCSVLTCGCKDHLMG